MKWAAIQFGILAIVSALVAVTTYVSGHIAADHWSEMLSGEKLPWGTVCSVDYGYLLGVGCCVTAMIGSVLALRAGELQNRLSNVFVMIACTELIGLAFIGFAYVQPAIGIMYRIGTVTNH